MDCPQKPYIPPQQESDSEPHSQIPQGGVSLLTISIYERTVTSPYAIHRTSTHVFLSNQTLGDLCNIMPCPSKEQPGEVRDPDGNLTSYDLKTPDMTGCVVCVAGFAYGDGLEVDDYAE
jgi:snRNA-activating protein complex subunit 3